MNEVSGKLQTLDLTSDEENGEVRRSTTAKFELDPTLISRRIEHIRRTIRDSIAELVNGVRDVEAKQDTHLMNTHLKQTSRDVFYSTLTRTHRHAAQLTSLADTISQLIWIRDSARKRRSRRSMSISRYRQRTMPRRPDTPITDEEPTVRVHGNLNHLR